MSVLECTCMSIYIYKYRAEVDAEASWVALHFIHWSKVSLNWTWSLPTLSTLAHWLDSGGSVSTFWMLELQLLLLTWHFRWVLEKQTPVLELVQQVLCPMNHLSIHHNQLLKVTLKWLILKFWSNLDDNPMVIKMT